MNKFYDENIKPLSKKYKEFIYKKLEKDLEKVSGIEVMYNILKPDFEKDKKDYSKLMEALKINHERNLEKRREKI